MTPLLPPLHFGRAALLRAWLVATLFSGIPSTLLAWWQGGDLLEATRAAGAMLLPAASGTPALVVAAAIVHPAVSAFWTLVFGWLLPRRHVAVWALAGSAAVALLSLKLISPLAFDEVAALVFWPQFADHLMWGALLGFSLQRSVDRNADRKAHRTSRPPLR